MGASQRRKGARGQTEAKHLLAGLGWTVDPITCGIAAADLVATDPSGRAWTCEVKTHKILDLTRFVRQAQEQGRKRRLPWLLLARIPGHAGCWLVVRQGERPTIWHSRDEDESDD